MSADQFLQNLTDALFVLIFILVLARTLRKPYRANIDASLLFGAVALIVGDTWIVEAVGTRPPWLANVIVASLLMALPYLLLRLVDDYAGVPPRLLWMALIGLVLSILVLAAFRRLPLSLTLLLVAYFVALSGYVAYAVVRVARQSSGVTRRRMRAVAVGTGLLGLVILLAGAQAAFPGTPVWMWRSVSDLLSLACGVGYYIGFAPPPWLRRAWQEPELRAFLSRAASLPRLPSTTAIVWELEQGAARSLGMSTAAIGVWNPSAEELVFGVDADRSDAPLVDTIARRAFAEEAPVFIANAMRESPGDAALYRAAGVNSVLAVPIVAGGSRLGVLALYAARAPIFAEDDLKLARLLADQAAVVLESRALIDEAARVRALEEATRLKDDFLSAAAHDLKTPLTAVIAQAQLMERRARRDPATPADLRGIERIVQDAQRLRRLVTELLDVDRVEQGRLLEKRSDVDLSAVIREACARHTSALRPCRFDGPARIVGSYDEVRIVQLLDNLLENGVKYSPQGGPIDVSARVDGGMAHITVTDRGISIPANDLDHLFERFHRGTNVDDRRFSGMGLGLFICRGIAAEHGGRLWATSPGPGHGSTFHVTLPMDDPVVPAATGCLPDRHAVAPGEAS